MIVNLLLGLVTMILCLFMQGLLLVRAMHFYARKQHLLERASFWSGLLVIKGVMLLLVIGNLLQIAIWAALFTFFGEFTEYSEAFYHSAVNFATLGYGDLIMSEENLVRKAIEMVAEGNVNEAVKILIKSLKENTDWSVRSYSAQILGELGKIPSLSKDLKVELVSEMLITLKDEKDGWVREALTKAFGKIGQNFADEHPELIKQIIPRLIYVLINDDHEGAKGSAAKSLGDIGKIAPELIIEEDKSLINNQSHLAHIAKRLELDESWIVRYYTAYAIGEIGTIKPNVVSDYTDVLKNIADNDPDNGVRNSAQEALDKIKNALED